MKSSPWPWSWNLSLFGERCPVNVNCSTRVCCEPGFTNFVRITNTRLNGHVRSNSNEQLNKALPHSGKTQDSSTYKTQNSRSSCAESNGNTSVHSRRAILGTRKMSTKNNIEDAHWNWEKWTTIIVTGSPANTANEIITIPETVSSALSVAELGIWKMKQPEQ